MKRVARPKGRGIGVQVVERIGEHYEIRGEVKGGLGRACNEWSPECVGVECDCGDGSTPKRADLFGASAWRRKEDAALVAAGFEALEEEQDLWHKDGTVFGRGAALQKARCALAESGWYAMFDGA